MVQAEFASRADIHGWTLAHRLHATEDFNGIRVVIAARASIASVNRSHFSVFCCGICDGSIDLFGGHSAPRKCPNLFLRTPWTLAGKFARSASFAECLQSTQ